MGVMATLAAGLRVALAAAPASLTPLPENVPIEDVPDADKTYFSIEPTTEDALDNEHGGGTYIMRISSLVVRVAWNLDVDEESFADTKANDIENIGAVMDKPSNWTSGVVLVQRTSSSERKDKQFYRADLTYSVRYRVAQTLT